MVLKTNVGKSAMRVLLIGIALLILINILARFGVVDFTGSTANIITIIGSLFLLMEVGIVGMLRTRKLNFLNIIIAIVAIIALVGSITGLLGVSIGLLQPIQGIVDIALMVAVILEIFR